MTRIQRTFLLSLAVLAGLWTLADPTWPQPFKYFSFRAWAMQGTGVLAIGAMSLIMVLAVRPVWLEPPLQGLDKMYRLHKWLGITALVTAVVHWWLGQGTKWMVGWGWLVRPQRGPRPAAADQPLLEAWLGSQRGLAETVGEWAFYLAAVLMVLALVKRFPYRWFAKTHTVLAAGYLALVFHSVVLLKWTYWTQPVGLLMAVLMVAGSVAAVLVLGRRIGARRKVSAVVTATERFDAVQSLEFRVRVDAGWPGHRAGQFAFVTTDAAEGAHPFTMASAWNPETRELRFIAKALGDHTAALPRQLQAGQTVTVEGPYGCFDFDDGAPRQIWVGAGIGITPFIARLEHLAASGSARGQQIDLFHPTAQEEPLALLRLKAAARAAGVRLHLMVDRRDGLLDGEHLRRTVPDWAQASLWFCGPAAFGRALKADLSAHGLRASAFHQELFEMR
ncbi:ferredoxin reductase family protein [Ideonella livida]|uniref:Ferric reductase n=1 Tax=Ideonella livida TaxID=2707176 RepID=A0A7C9TJP7_9BURK|nr:ferric reductase-like transmembrane domain-containing protein [Ideonella livida]NDY90387.1 ferric reductase [Ideonella livida]